MVVVRVCWCFCASRREGADEARICDDESERQPLNRDKKVLPPRTVRRTAGTRLSASRRCQRHTIDPHPHPRIQRRFAFQDPVDSTSNEDFSCSVKYV